MPTPSIKAGGTFTARLSMPRAGTFMYHTHLNDQEQLMGGLYGPIVVLEPGKVFDPKTDHVHIAGWDVGKKAFQAVVNGDSLASPPIEMRVGETHRFRFINIGLAEPVDFTLKRDTTLVDWTPIAKDGADLPPSQRVTRKAQLVIDVGQTWDFEFKPTAPGAYVLSAPTGPKGRKWERLIVVR
jgi:FtsP/CotA-like multicopper oxidase with cupredoxin domain